MGKDKRLGKQDWISEELWVVGGEYDQNMFYEILQLMKILR